MRRTGRGLGIAPALSRVIPRSARRMVSKKRLAENWILVQVFWY